MHITTKPLGFNTIIYLHRLGFWNRFVPTNNVDSNTLHSDNDLGCSGLALYRTVAHLSIELIIVPDVHKCLSIEGTSFNTAPEVSCVFSN